MLQVDNIFVDNDGLAASAAEQLNVDLSLFLTNVEGLPWDSTSFGQKEQKEPSANANGTVNGAANGNANTSTAYSTSGAWLHSSVQSGSAGSGDGPLTAQRPSIISTYCPQVLPYYHSLLWCLGSLYGAECWHCFSQRASVIWALYQAGTPGMFTL